MYLSSLIPNLSLHSQARLSFIHARSLTLTAVSHSRSHRRLSLMISPSSEPHDLTAVSIAHSPCHLTTTHRRGDLQGLHCSSHCPPSCPHLQLLPLFLPLSLKPSFFFLKILILIEAFLVLFLCLLSQMRMDSIRLRSRLGFFFFFFFF